VVEDATIAAAGAAREQMEALGPVRPGPRVGGPLRAAGFVNCHYHSELAIGPGLYQHIFEKAKRPHPGRDRADRGGGPVPRILWGLVTAIRGRQTATVDMY
jgi:5-methylthioadenosine/S-adenosylhomocysteine deaminase